jgi:hypothetical protein
MVQSIKGLGSLNCLGPTYAPLLTDVANYGDGSKHAPIFHI